MRLEKGSRNQVMKGKEEKKIKELSNRESFFV